jgi:hypothetical protein
MGFIQGLDIAQKGAKATGPAAPFAFPIFYAAQIAAVLGAAGKAKAILKKDDSASKQTSGKTSSISISSTYGAGGILGGPSHAAGGIMTPFGELEGGEAVINKNSTAMYSGILSAINQAGGGKAFPASGTQVQNGAVPIVKTYVVASEMSSQQEADAKVSRLARL